MNVCTFVLILLVLDIVATITRDMKSPEFFMGQEVGIAASFPSCTPTLMHAVWTKSLL